MPKTRYTKSGDANLAYQVVGDGPIDLLYLAGWVTNIEAMWEDPGYERFLNRLASIARLIVYDKRGVGLSDPVPPEQLTDQALRIRDAQAVMGRSFGRSRPSASRHFASFGSSEPTKACRASTRPSDPSRSTSWSIGCSSRNGPTFRSAAAR